MSEDDNELYCRYSQCVNNSFLLLLTHILSFQDEFIFRNMFFLTFVLFIFSNLKNMIIGRVRTKRGFRFALMSSVAFRKSFVF